VSKPRQHRSGFSKPHSSQTSRREPTQSSADHFTKEQQAVSLINQGKLQEAEALYRELISAGRSNHILYGNLAALCGKQGRFDELIKLLRKALQLNPNYPKAHFNLGNAHQQQGDLHAAITSYNTALRLKPNHPEAHNNLGNAQKKQGDLDAAIASYNTALRLKPNYPEAHYNLGNALKKQGDLDAAIASYNTALQLKPNYSEAHNNLGNALQRQGDLDAAIACYNSALRLKPNYPEAHYNIGNVLKEQGDLDAAIASYNTALRLKPNYPEARWNSSTTMLLGDDYKNGWKRFDSRFARRIRLDAYPPLPAWKGEKTTKEAPLLLISEQGFGDTIQFMRYVRALREKGVETTLCIPEKLHGLARASGLDQNPISPKEAQKVSRGFYAPLMSLGRILGITPESPIVKESYIKTDTEQVNKWSHLLAAESKPIIGIHWQGNPNHEKNNLAGRSLPLEKLAPAVSAIDCKLLSLQKGFGSEQLENCSFKHLFVSCQDQVNDTWDFLETAAIIRNCNLIITSDSALAHLAGGMGTTTWLLLQKIPDWRWGLEGDTRFWYPSMRLFRQKERGNWDEVVERVAEALQEHSGSSSTSAEPSPAPQPAIKLEPIQDILAPISLGELIDKITILQIKTTQLQGTSLENVRKELEALESILNNLKINIDTTLIQRLKEVNQDLWKIEDDIRDQDRKKTYGETFIRLARSVYQQNDRRAAIKKEINTTYGSAFVEEKSYHHY